MSLLACPMAPVLWELAFGKDGAIYGTTGYGGTCTTFYGGCGTVFKMVQ